MFRLRTAFFLVPLASLAVLCTGCHVMYRDVYSPRRNFYVRPTTKTVAPVLPEEKKPVMPVPMTPPAGGVPALPAGGAAAPGIPGLEPVPGGTMTPAM